MSRYQDPHLTCPCACHRLDVIAVDMQRQLDEEDAALIWRIKQAAEDIHGGGWDIASGPNHKQLKAIRNELPQPCKDNCGRCSGCIYTNSQRNN